MDTTDCVVDSQVFGVWNPSKSSILQNSYLHNACIEWLWLSCFHLFVYLQILPIMFLAVLGNSCVIRPEFEPQTSDCQCSTRCKALPTLLPQRTGTHELAGKNETGIWVEIRYPSKPKYGDSHSECNKPWCLISADRAFCVMWFTFGIALLSDGEHLS